MQSSFWESQKGETMTQSRYTTFVVTVILALALSAMSTVPVLADDTVPPPTETPTVEEVPPTDVPVGEPITAVEESASQAASVAQPLTQVPAETEVVIIEEGETAPLANIQTTQAIEFVDPIWCPTGVTPKISTGGCSTSFGSLKDLINGFVPTKNGVIWIEKDADTDVSHTPLLISGGL